MFDLFFLLDDVLDLLDNTFEHPGCERARGFLVFLLQHCFLFAHHIIEVLHIDQLSVARLHSFDRLSGQVAVGLVFFPYGALRIRDVLGVQLGQDFVNNLLGGFHLGVLLNDRQLRPSVVLRHTHIP